MSHFTLVADKDMGMVKEKVGVFRVVEARESSGMTLT